MAEQLIDFESVKFVDDKVLQDPEPAVKKNPPRQGAKSAPVGRPSKSNKQSELQNDFEGMLLLAMFPLKLRDIHDYETGESCADMFIQITDKGTFLTPQAKQLSAAFAAVGVDNKYIMKFFNMGDQAGKYLALAMAMQPFVIGVIQHHVRSNGHHAGNDSMG